MKTLASLALLALTFSAAQSPSASIATSKIFAALEMQKGQTVGEIGAGDGDLTIEAWRRLPLLKAIPTKPTFRMPAVTPSSCATSTTTSPTPPR
jgi:hypothetical protein